MPLLKNRKVVTDDAWAYVRDGEAVPASGDVIVNLPRLLAEKDALLSRSGKVGVSIEPTDDIAEVVPLLAKLPLVVIHFPKFGDGRGYTKARLLRERHGYKGEIRAVGEVLGDQLFFMQRCGFDAFYLVDGKSVEAALRCLEDFSVTYQPAADEPRALFRRVARGQTGT